jgi:proteic killer suppression protein
MLDISNIKCYYNYVMIKSFKSKETELVWNGQFSTKLPHDIQKIALRKLIMLHKSIDLNDFKIPSSNQLERLKGNRLGQYSIRINNQWRICFLFQRWNAFSVEIIDYH